MVFICVKTVISQPSGDSARELAGWPSFTATWNTKTGLDYIL